MAVRLENPAERAVGVQFIHYLHNGVGQRWILERQRFGMRIIAGQRDAEEVLPLAAIIESLLCADERATPLAGRERLKTSAYVPNVWISIAGLPAFSNASLAACASFRS